MKEQLAKARVRAQILENVEFGEEQELQGEILGYRQQSSHPGKPRKKILKSHTVNKIVII